MDRGFVSSNEGAASVGCGEEGDVTPFNGPASFQSSSTVMRSG